MQSRPVYRLSFGGKLTPVVTQLIIINALVYVFMILAKDSTGLLAYLGLIPSAIIEKRYLWQFISYMFIHIDFWHIFFNLLFLWWFGCDIERNFGKKHFVRYYFLTGIGAGLFAFLIDLKSTIPIIGASGGIFGIFLAYAILFPNRKIYLWFVIPVKAKWVVLGTCLIEVFALMSTEQSGVSHSAHVGGVIAGLLWFGYYLKILRLMTLKSLFSGKSRKKRGQQLYIVKDKMNDMEDFYDDDRDGTVH